MFEQTSAKTWLWYRTGVRSIYKYPALASMKLDEITPEHVTAFTGHRQAQGLAVASVNSSLQVLRRCLNLAVEWGVVEKAPKIQLLRNVKRRERVIKPEEEAKYLASSPEPLASVATVLVDSGMRPEECFRLRWENINLDSAKHGLLLISTARPLLHGECCP